MKKTVSKLTAAIVTAGAYLLATLFQPTVYALERIPVYSEFYDEVVESEEFRATVDRRMRGEMLQLSDDMLHAMDTDTLIDAVLNYPYFMDIYAFDNIQTGIDMIFGEFNGAQELMKRQDAPLCLLEKYENYEVLSPESQKAMNLEERGEAVFALSNLEVILSQEFVLTNLSDAEIERLNNAAADKYSEKEKCDSYGMTKNTYYKACYSLYGESDESMRTQTAYVTTPNGTNVPVTIRGEELTSAEISDLNRNMGSNYPTAVWLRTATTNYNCHSYAWHNQAAGNIYWMSNPSYYWTDGSYSSVSTSAAGDRMVYKNGSNLEHSAVIYVKASGPPSANFPYADLLTVWSKWGSAGVYRHAAIDSPYWAYTTSVAYYHR